MDMSGGVGEIPMRTDSKNLVTTTRTIHFPKQRKPVQGVFMILFTFQLRIAWQIVLRRHQQRQTI